MILVLSGGEAAASGFAQLNIQALEADALDRVKIEWSTAAPAVKYGTIQGRADQSYVQLQGTIDVNGDSQARLVIGDWNIPMKGNGVGKKSFSFMVPIEQMVTVVDIGKVYLNKKIAVERVKITTEFSDIRSSKPVEKAPPPRKVSFLGVSADLTSITYQETGLANLTELALTGKFSYLLELAPRKWDLGISGFATLLPISTNQAGVSLRFFGINGRMGYVVPWIREPFRFSLLVGGYYTTTMSSGLPFGFRNMFGPQVFPTLRYNVTQSDAVTVYFKYSPILNGSTLTFQSKEVAYGASWGHSLANRHPLSFSVNASQLDLNLDTGTGKLDILSQTLSVGVGYGL